MFAEIGSSTREIICNVSGQARSRSVGHPVSIHVIG